MKRVLITGAKGKFAEALSQYFESKGYGIWQPGGFPRYVCIHNCTCKHRG